MAMKANEQIYQHLTAEEMLFIDRAIDWIHSVEDNYLAYTTSFLNPREVTLLKNRVSSYQLQFFSSSEIIETELSKVIIAPDYYQLDQVDFGLALLEIQYSSQFTQLTHAQVLGSFLGQSGVRRQEIGDILISEERAQIFVSQHLADYFIENIKKIGRAGVKLKRIDLSQAIQTETKSETKVLLVSSVRLDKIIATAFNFSRNIATNMLQSNKVKVNFSEVSEKDTSLQTGDLISLRGYGRVKILRNLGLTKKDKQKIEVELIKNRKQS